jgi:hypothetical protein
MSRSEHGLDVELKSPVAKAALFMLLLAVGIAMTGWGVLVVREALDSRSWPTVEGTVIVSETRHVPARESADRRSSYQPEVAVEYEVDGQTLICDRLTFTTISFDRAMLVRELLRPYPVGKKVSVSYDPDDPARSVLDPRLRFTAFLLPAVGAMLTIGTIGAGAWSIFHRAERDAPTDG